MLWAWWWFPIVQPLYALAIRVTFVPGRLAFLASSKDPLLNAAKPCYHESPQKDLI